MIRSALSQMFTDLCAALLPILGAVALIVWSWTW